MDNLLYKVMGTEVKLVEYICRREIGTHFSITFYRHSNLLGLGYVPAVLVHVTRSYFNSHKV